MNKARPLVLASFIILGFPLAAPAQSEVDNNDVKGFYVGGYVGGTMGRSDASTTTVFSPTGYFATSSVPAIAAVGAQEVEPNGFTGGGTFGYNWQWKNTVLGLETDFGAMPLEDQITGTAEYPCCAPTEFSITQRVEADWVWTLRPRVGFNTHKALIYVTVGLAVTNLQYTETFSDTFAAAAESARAEETEAGWTLGGGVEFKTGPHWLLRAEYLYADFGEVGTTSTNFAAFTPPIAFPTNVFTHTADLRTHHLRFGVNYRF